MVAGCVATGSSRTFLMHVRRYGRLRMIAEMTSRSIPDVQPWGRRVEHFPLRPRSSRSYRPQTPRLPPPRATMDPNRFVQGQFQAQMAPVQQGGYFHPTAPPPAAQVQAQQYGLQPLQMPPPNQAVVPQIQMAAPQIYWQPGGTAAYAPAHHVQPQPTVWMAQPQPQTVPVGQFQPMAVGFVQHPQQQQPVPIANDLLSAALAERYLRETRARAHERGPAVDAPSGGERAAVPVAARAKDEHANGTGAPRLSAEDEKVLVDALREGTARGLTMGQVVDQLQKVRGTSIRFFLAPGDVQTELRVLQSNGRSGWQDWFVQNIERLLPQLQPATHATHTRRGEPDARGTDAGRSASTSRARPALSASRGARKR